MGREAELTALLKLKNDPQNKSVMDNMKGDLERALGQFSAKGTMGQITPKMLSMMSPSDRAMVEKKGEDSAKAFTKGWKRYGMADLPRLTGSSPGSPMAHIAFGKGSKSGVNWKTAALGASTAMFNPWIGSRLLSDAFSGKGGGGSGGGGGGGIAKGIFGAAGAMGFGEFYTAINAFKKAVEIFVNAMKSALQKGYNIYTQSAQQGLNSRFFTQRQTAASVLGVGGNPNEVFKFGAAVQYVTQRTASANQILSQTARPLAEVTMQFKILKVDLDALYAKIASGLVPSLNQATNAIDMMVKAATGLVTVAQNIWKYTKWAPWNIAARFATGEFTRSALFGSGKDGNIPPMIPSMKQLPASSWEHMGLVIGGGGSNPAQQTAKNTGQMVKILAAMMRGNRGGSAVQFGLNPLVSNP